MSFSQYVPGVASGTNGDRTVEGLVDECCPLIADAMSGEWSAERGLYVRKPYSLTIWSEGGMVKLCLGADDKNPKWFWSCSTLEALMEQAEAALKAGKGNWWQPSERKRR